MLIFHFYAHTSLVRSLTTTRNEQHSYTEEAHAQRTKHHEDTTYGELGHSNNREDKKFSFELVEELKDSSANPLVTFDDKEDATKAIEQDEQSDLEFVSDFYSIPSFQTAKESICGESDNVIVGDIVSSNKNDEKLVITETKKQDDNKKHFAYKAKKKLAKIKRMVHKAYKKACKKGDDAFRYVFLNVSSNKRSGTEQDVCQSETQKSQKIETTDADTHRGEDVTVELQNPDTSQDSLMIYEWDTLADAETAKNSAVNTKSIDCEFEISDNTKRFVDVYYLLRDYLVSNNYELRDDERIMEMLQTTLKLDERKVSYNILEHKSDGYVYVAHTGEHTADSLVMVDENVILPLKQTEERDSIATTLSKCVSSELIYDEQTGKKKLKVKILITDHAHEAFETVMSKMEPYYDLIRKGLENALVSRSVELYYIVSSINAFFNSSIFQFLAHIATRRE